MINRKKLGVIGLSFLIIAAVLAWQWNNVMAVFLFSQYSKSELSAKLFAEKTVSEKTIKKLLGSITDLTEEDKDKLENEDINQADEAELNIKGSDSEIQYQSKVDTEVASAEAERTDKAIPGSLPSEKIQAAENEDDKRIKELVAELFVLKASYTDSIDKLVKQAKSEYRSLPESEQTGSNKQKLLLKYIGQASGMESTCDSIVSDIIAELRKLLTKTGGDISLINDIETTYNQEKSLKKAYYISLLKNR